MRFHSDADFLDAVAAAGKALKLREVLVEKGLLGNLRTLELKQF